LWYYLKRKYFFQLKTILMKTFQHIINRLLIDVLFLFCMLFTSSLITHQVSAQSNCWLETQGTQIVNAATGQPVVLRAVGLGNWLLQEGYMLNPQGCTGCPGTQWQMKKQYY